MKTSIRIITLMLALFMAVSVFVACEGSTDKDDADTQNTENETEVFPEVDKKNYGDDFHLLVQPNCNRIDLYWVDEGDNDALSEALYSRQQKVYDYLGVDITATESLGHNKYGEPFMNSVKNKDGSVDTLLSHAYMYLSRFIQGGYLLDFKDIDGINLNADYWSLDIMEEVAAGDHLYLGYSDFRLANTHAIAFNKSMLDQYRAALDETLYETVTNYRWTIDKMVSLASLVYIDATANGKTEDDTFGITGEQWVPFINLLQASNINLVDVNEKGEYVVSVYTDVTKERTSALVDKLSALSKSDYAWFKYKTEPTPVIKITSGKTLLSFVTISSLPSYLAYDVDFGVIPYPMFDENQKDVGYRSLDWGGWFCVPSYVGNLDMVADTLEVIAFYSDDVHITYYEKLLGKQVADAPDDRAMLDIIWDSVCSDVGLTYSNIATSLDINLYMLPTVTQANATEQLASFVKSYEATANKLLKKYFSNIDKVTG